MYLFVFVRLWNKMKNEKRIVYPDQQRLDEISSMFNGVKFANVDNFADSEVIITLFF